MAPPTTMLDIPRRAHEEPEIMIYGPKECPNCDKAMGLFDRSNITFTKVSIEPGDANHHYITEELGYQVAPVIVMKIANDNGTGDRMFHWGGHRMDMLVATRSLVANIRAVKSSAAQVPV